MPIRSELIFTYNKESFVVSAKCSRCNEEMPAPPPDMSLPEERVLWFAQHFVAHKKQHHPAEVDNAS